MKRRVEKLPDYDPVAEIFRALPWLKPEDREKLAPEFSPGAIRRCRQAERDELIKWLAATGGKFSSGREAARMLAEELSRYAASAWKTERNRAPGGGARRAALHRLLTLMAGRTLTGAAIRDILSGVASLAENRPTFSATDCAKLPLKPSR